MITDDELVARFTHHPPTGTDMIEKYQLIRRIALEYARALVRQTPESREQSLALTALDEVVFWANAAVARRE